MKTRGEGRSLRQRAERALSKRLPRRAPKSPADLESVVHELQVHQIELEMQNDALGRAKAALQATRDHYASLYHFAPVAFVTLDAAAIIGEANPAAGALLGIDRLRLLGRSLAGHVKRQDQAAFLRHLGEVAGGTAPGPFELELVRRDGARRTVRLDTTVQRSSAGKPATYHCTLTDVTDHIRLTRELHAQRVLLERRGTELQELSTRLLVAREEEARRIAADLHDDIGQRLEAISVELGVGLRSMREAAHPLASGVGATLRQLGEVASDIDRLCRQIHPKMVDDLGLAVALRAHAQDLERRTGIPVRLRHGRALPRLKPAVEIAAYRIAQEALRNVVRHARARRVTVTLAPTGSGLGLCVADDGRGFDPRTCRRGLGLTSMEARALTLGGWCRVRSASGRGTHVHMRLPIEPPTS